MPAESYKKWIVIGIIVLFAGIVVFVAVSSQPQKSSGVAQQGAASRPLGDIKPIEVIPVDKLGVDAGNPKALSSLADKYFEDQNFNQAVEIYQRVLELMPNDIDTYNDLGLAYNYTNRPDLAIETLKKGTEIEPSYQRIWLSLGYVMMTRDMKEEAKAALNSAAALDPDSIIGQEAVRMMGLIK